jgi:PAS domain S-box-containing protein
MVGVNRDITDKRKSEVALRISEERYRSVVDALGEGIILQDQTGKVITSNTSAEKILGLSCEQLRGLTSLDAKWHCIHDDGRPFPAHNIRE